MLRFFLRRVGEGIVVVWFVTSITFAVFFIAPNDVARTLAGRQATPATVAAIRSRLGLDRSVGEQYRRFLWRAVHGDLGFDYYHGRPVTTVIAEDLPATMSIAVGGTIIAFLLGVGAGVATSRRPRSTFDRIVTGAAVVFYSVPTFLVGLVLLYVAYFRLSKAGVEWFPAGGYVGFTDNPGQWLRHLVLPWLTLAAVYAATYTRLSRAAMLDTLELDFVRTARAKGLSERRVVYRHALRNALTPVTSQLGIDLGGLVGASVLVEAVFGISGLGRESLTAINDQNLPVIVGIVIFTAAAIVAANIAVDVAYAFLDPRVRAR